MLCQPKNTKYSKQFKGRIKGVSKSGAKISFGEFALKAQSPNRVSAREIESARRAIRRGMKRDGIVLSRIFPDVSVTAKPTETRMGSGKGSHNHWVSRVKPGRILFELDGVSEEVAREALRLGAAKLSVITKFVKRIVE